MTELPNAAERLLLLQLAVSKLSEAGYEYIGMDHFALPGDSLAQAKHDGTIHRSFQGYTTHANRDLVSFGVSAIGHVGDLYVQNHKLLAAYAGALASGMLPTSRGRAMSRDDHIRKEVINAIMCQGIVDIAAIEASNCHQILANTSQRRASGCRYCKPTAWSNSMQIYCAYIGGASIDAHRRHGIRCVCQRCAWQLRAATACDVPGHLEHPRMRDDRTRAAMDLAERKPSSS